MSKNPSPLQYDRYYHIYSRGINRENIFFEKRNYYHFLKLYGNHCAPITNTYAYCLLRNHFHFLVRVKPVEDLTGFQNLSGLKRLKKPSQYFSNLLNAYTKAINNAHPRTGSLFQRPFGRIEVTSDAHFINLIKYIHFNPEKHGFVDDFRDWPYSSYPALLTTKRTRLDRDEVLEWFGDTTNFKASHENNVDVKAIEHLVADDIE